jgi:serine protease DegQ
MKNFYRLIQFVAQFITLGLALAFVISLFAPQWTARLHGQAADGSSAPATVSPLETARPQAAKPAVHKSDQNASFGPRPNGGKSSEEAGSITTSYASAVEAASPAVVSIFVNKMEEQTRQIPFRTSNPNLPPLVLAQVTTNVPIQSLGSGVIVNTDGYVLTNYHVIESATNISAVMPDGHAVAAQIVGSDEQTDLAVLKLDIWNPTPIPIAKDPASVGDIVLAIGNPFGFDKTVTMGIVSAVERVVDPATGEDFIQTDAAINSGNSGGALVNAYGELVGINSRSYSPSGNVGISFAVPVATAKTVLDQIIHNGRVIRGWIGANYRDVPPQPNDPMPVVNSGALVISIEPDSPADKAGLKIGDEIVRLDGKWVKNQSALRKSESRLAPGTKIALTVKRGDQLQQVDVELAERPDKQNKQQARRQPTANAADQK